ncbi:MAG: LEA type 2 family protein [Ferruginibacter sp.]|nr:LEA type 2 family protein [Ferruginibacter sp.]
MKKSHYFPIVGLAIVLLFLSSCQKPKDLVFKDFKNLTVDKLTFANAQLKVDLVYYNPNNFSLQLSRTDLDIFVDSTFLGHSLQDVQISIPKKADFTLPLKVDLDVKNLLKNGIFSLLKKDVKVKMVGSVKIGKAGVYKSFPVNYTSVQNLSMFK